MAMSLTKGLVGHWTFDEHDTHGAVVQDRTGYNQAGSLNGATTSEPTTPVGGGRRLTAASDRVGRGGYFRAPEYPEFDFDNTTPFTFATWFRYDAPSGRWNNGSFIGANAINILAKGTTSNSYGLTLDCNLSYADPSDQHTATTLNSFQIVSRVRDGSNGRRQPAATGFGPEHLGEWIHVAGVYEPDGAMTIYINGEPQASDSSAVGDFSNDIAPDSNYATTSGNYTPQNFTISDARIYNRALSEEEIERLADMRSPNRGVSSSLQPIGHWTLHSSDVAGGEIKDRTANDAHGTVRGDVTFGTESPIGEAGTFPGVSGSDIIIPNTIWDNDKLGLSMWVKPHTITADNTHAVFSTQNLLIQFTTDRLRMWGNTSNAASVSFRPPTPIQQNVWHHVAISYDYATGDLDQYVNGEKNSLNYPNVVPNRAQFAIGSWNGNSRQFPGEISDVRLFNRTLTESEVNRLYDIRSPDRMGMERRHKMSGEWRCNPGVYTGKQFPDATGYDHTSTVTGTITAGDPSPWGGSVHIDSENYVLLEDANQFDRNLGDEFSFMCAFKPDVLDSGFHHGVLQRGMFANSYGIDLTGTGQIATFVRGVDGASAASANSQISVGEWRHIIGSYDGSTVRCFDGGELVGASTYTGGDFSGSYGTDGFRLGNDRARGGSSTTRGDFNGDIGYAAFLDRAITTEAEAQRFAQQRTVGNALV